MNTSLRLLIIGLPLAAGMLALASCANAPNAPPSITKRQPWRTQTESACLSSGIVRESRFLQTRSSLGGPGVCGAQRPFSMTGANGGRVRMRPAATLRCPMIPRVEQWVSGTVLPAARYHFGSPVVQMRVAASYSCRTRNHKRGAKLSEHGLANALDISSFTLADGRTVTVKRGWNGPSNQRAFLRAVHRGACDNFTTVLGPKADRYHHDHFHMDLARHGRKGTYKVCR